MSYNEDLQQHNSDLEEVLAMAQALPDAGVQVETCRVVMVDAYGYSVHDVTMAAYTAFEGGELVTKQSENPFAYNDTYGAPVAVLENVAKNTSIELIGFDNASFDCENAEYWFAAENLAAEWGYVVHNFRILSDATITINA